MEIRPTRVSLDDAFHALKKGEDGSARYPLSWEADSYQWGVSLHQPVIQDGLVYQVGARGVQAFDVTTGEAKFTIPGDDVSAPAVSGQNLVLGDRDSLALYSPSERKELWSIDRAEGWGKSPHVTPDGTILAGDGCQVMALNPADGSSLWTTSLPSSAGIMGYSAESKVTVGYTGIYASETQQLFVLDEKGHELWSTRYDKASLAERGPLFVVREKLFKLFGSSHSLKAMDPRTGRKLWSEKADGQTEVWASPAGHVVVRDGLTMRLRDGQTGEQRWTYQLNSEPDWNVRRARVTFSETEVIVTHPDGAMTGLDPSSGSVLWDEKSRGVGPTSPTVGPDGILVMKVDGKVKGLLPTKFVEHKPRVGKTLEETDDGILMGSVHLRKRK